MSAVAKRVVKGVLRVDGANRDTRFAAKARFRDLLVCFPMVSNRFWSVVRVFGMKEIRRWVGVSALKQIILRILIIAPVIASRVEAVRIVVVDRKNMRVMSLIRH